MYNVSRYRFIKKKTDFPVLIKCSKLPNIFKMMINWDTTSLIDSKFWKIYKVEEEVNLQVMLGKCWVTEFLQGLWKAARELIWWAACHTSIQVKAEDLSLSYNIYLTRLARCKQFRYMRFLEISECGRCAEMIVAPVIAIKKSFN